MTAERKKRTSHRSIIPEGSSFTSSGKSTFKNLPPHSAFHFGTTPVFANVSPLQTKPAGISQGNKYEKEANSIADRIVQMPGKSSIPRKPVSPAITPVTDTPGETGAITDHSTVDKISESRGEGSHLDKNTQSFMSDRFGVNFNQVRIHTDEEAVQMNRNLNAKAFTVQENIYFNKGEYEPGSEQGKKLLAHELTHVVQSKGKPIVQRAVINDPTGNPSGFEFRIGNELTKEFVTLARENVRDGALSDADLRKLREDALKKRGTLNDFERMFLAGLLDPSNVQILQRTPVNATAAITFPIASITNANLQHLINLDRNSLPDKVSKPFNEAVESLKNFRVGDAAGKLDEAEKSATHDILNNTGSFKTQATDLVSFAKKSGVLLSRVLQAMLAAASDNTRGDQIFAGIAYAVAENTGLSVADDLLAGKIKVDALIPSAFGRLGVQSNTVAAYVTLAQATGMKGDTIYLQTNTDINNLGDRSAIIHELTHAVQDKSGAPTGRVTFTPQERAELGAYRQQGSYILTQLAAMPAADQPVGARQSAKGGGLVLGGIFLEGQKDKPKFKLLLDLIFASAPAPFTRSAAQITATLALPVATIEAAVLADINTAYHLSPGQNAAFDSLSGESFINWVFRT
jgi:hypothetical protein